MILVGGAEAEIDEIDVVCEAPVDGGEEGGEIGAEGVVEDFHGEEVGLGGAVMDQGGDGGAVAEAVDVGGIGCAGGDGYAACYVADVRMGEIYAAVDYGDASWSLGIGRRLSL